MYSKTRSYFKGLVQNYGFCFSMSLVSAFGVIKGIMYQIVQNGSLPYYKRLGVTGQRYQSLATVAATPWAMKAGMGLLSDTYALLGYHKRSYIAITSVISALALTAMALLPYNEVFAPLAAFFLLLVTLQVACVDLLSEAKYAEIMNQNKQSGTEIVSFVWGLFSIGCVAGSLISGPISDHFDVRLLFAACAPLAMQAAIPSFTGWFPENRVEHVRVRRDKLKAHPGLALLAFVMTVGALIIAMVSALGSPVVQALVSLGVASGLAALGSVCMPPMIRQANLFLFLNNALYVSLSGALDFFFTADGACVPDGPHFSMTYFVTWANIVGGTASFIGVAMFQRALNGQTFRAAFCVGTFVRISASLFDYIIVKRYNIHILGISDHMFFMLGDPIISQLVAMLDLIPAVVLTARVVPAGMEASVFALLVSYQNLGAQIASAIGVGLVDALGIRTTVPCNFENLPMAIIIGHVVLPALAFPLIFLLIPNARISDDILESEATSHEDQTKLESLHQEPKRIDLSPNQPIGNSTAPDYVEPLAQGAVECRRGTGHVARETDRLLG